MPVLQRRQAALAAIELVGLNGFQQSPLWELSSGMRQRVQIARVLAYDPEFILLDEPFGSVDSQTKATLQVEFLNCLQLRPKTVILITHDVAEAVYMADRVLVLSKRPGRIVSEVQVRLTRPRGDIRFLENDSEFGRIKRHIWGMLCDENDGSPN